MKAKVPATQTEVVAIAQPDILTTEQLAHRLQVEPSYILEKTRSRCRAQIPAIRIGRYLRFDWLSVVRWLRQQEGTATEKRRYRRRKSKVKAQESAA